MSSKEGEQTSNGDLYDLLVRFQAESRADRLALWAEVHALKEGDRMSATDVAEIKRALLWQMALHRWVVKHKVKTSLWAVLGLIAGPLIGQGFAALLRWLGWN